jgi:cyclic-di-GMP-binding protein
MAKQQSFDVSTGCDLQEVDNAVNQARKELKQRFDFRNVDFTIDFRRAENALTLLGPDEYKINAIWDTLSTKLIRRQVSLKNFECGEIKPAGGMNYRQDVELKMGIDGDTAKRIVKFIKTEKLKKVQASIQGDEVRIVSPSRDVLQDVMTLLKGEDFGIELKFGNYR